MKAIVDPLPFVPATWIVGGRRRCGIAGIGEQALDAAERQVDRLRVEGEEARDQRVGRIPPCVALSQPQAAAAAGAAGAADFVRSRASRATVAFSSCRCTTMSTMP